MKWPGKCRNPAFYRGLVSIIFIGAGCLHLALPDPFLDAMPPSIPYPKAMIYLSGICEVAGGIGILIPRMRKLSAGGLILLLVAVFPANIHMFTVEWRKPEITWYSLFLLLRLPLQLVFMLWVCWARQVVVREEGVKF